MAKSSLDVPTKGSKAKIAEFTGVKLRVGIIGCGWIAGSHVSEYKQMPDVEIVAVCDLIEGKAEKFAKKHGLKVNCYGVHTEMLEAEKLDIVSVCTYNRTHAVCTIDALNKGINVMCEKPMCVTLEEATEMAKAAKKAGKKLSIGFQPRMDNNMVKLKEIISSGVLGKIYYIQTGGGRPWGIPTPFGTSFIEEKTAGIGAMGDIGCYSLDMVLNSIGYPKPLTVTGYTSNYIGKEPDTFKGHPEYADLFNVEDFAAGFIRLEGGIILDFRIAWAMHLDTPGDTIFMGTKASLKVPSCECWNGEIRKRMRIISYKGGIKVVKLIPRAKNKGGNVFYKKLRSFVDCVRNDTVEAAPAEQIIINQAIIDGIVKSAKLGKEIPIEIPQI